MPRKSTKLPVMNFKTVIRSKVPHGRNGKHKLVVSRILSDLNQLKHGSALKIPLAELGDTKAKVRSALNRATRKEQRIVATATDSGFLYVWNVQEVGTKFTKQSNSS